MSYDGFGYFAFVFSTEKTLRDDRNIQNLLFKISDLGWRFLAPRDYPYSVERNFLEDSPETIIDAWREAIKLGEHGARIDFCDAENFEAGLGLDFEHQYRKLLVTTNYGDLNETNPLAKDRMRSLINLCEIVYTSLFPEYGYGLTTPNSVPLNEYLDLNPHIYAIYDYNFIGEKMIKTFTRDKISVIPTWRRLEFLDGGLLLEMKPFPFNWEQEFSEYKQNYEIAAQVFGVEEYRIGI
jgi:hypothetical protein